MKHTSLRSGAYSRHLYGGSWLLRYQPSQSEPSPHIGEGVRKKVWRNNLAVADAINNIDYFAPTSLPTARRPWKNTVTNVPRHRAEELVPVRVAPDSSGPVLRSILRPEERTIQVMKVTVPKFSNRRDTVLDTFGGTFATAYECHYFWHHRKVLWDDSSGESV